MDSRRISVIATFAALAVALNLSPVKVPAPYAPFLIYQVWEVPIAAALLLYGPTVGVTIAGVNTLVLLAVFPGALPTGPLYNLAAVLSMLLGIQVVRGAARPAEGLGGARLIASATAVGTFTRVVAMTIVNWALIRYPPPVGFGIPEDALVALLPLIGVFNATLALYTIPLAYLISRAVRVRIGGTPQGTS